MNFGLESAAALMVWDILLSASTHWLRKKQHGIRERLKGTCYTAYSRWALVNQGMN